jgi:APA family basic amino acid/polyamine antiporter
MTTVREASGIPTGFQQRLGLFDATMLVAGSMIGSGIFIVSADISRDVGSTGWLLFVWVLTAVMTIMGALSLAELAGMMPHAGGTYVFLREAYGPLWGFLFGWTNFLVIQTGFIAAVGVAFAKFLGVLVPRLGTGSEAVLWEVQNLNIKLALPVPWMDQPLVFFERSSFTVSAGQFVALAVGVFLTVLNCLGVREGKFVQNLFTVAKTAGLVMLIVAGLTLAASSQAIDQNSRDVWSGITDTERFLETSKIVPVGGVAVVLVLCGAMVGSLFSADAWGNVTFAAAEVQNPRRNLPLSLFLGTGLVVLLYILANVGYLTALPVTGERHLHAQIRALERQATQLDGLQQAARAKELREEKDRLLKSASTFDRGVAYARDDRVATAVWELVSGRLGVPLMAVAIMISTFGCVNGIILANARLLYAMAQDRLFFRSVGQLSTRGVPTAGLVLQMLWACVLIFSGSYNELLDYVIFAALLFYVLTINALFVLRRKRPDWPRPYRALGYPVVPALYVLLCAVIMLALLVVKPVFSWPSFVIILTGIPVYLLWRQVGKGALGP